MKLIDGSALYKQIAEIEELARQRVLDTPSRMPNGDFNPYATRYATQLDERTKFKFMVADAPTIEMPRWIPVTKKLPNIGELVLVQFNDTRSDIMIAELAKYEVDDDKWELMWNTQEMSIEYDLEDVIAWQRLPELYKGERK